MLIISVFLYYEYFCLLLYRQCFSNVSIFVRLIKSVDFFLFVYMLLLMRVSLTLPEYLVLSLIIVFLSNPSIHPFDYLFNSEVKEIKFDK